MSQLQYIEQSVQVSVNRQVQVTIVWTKWSNIVRYYYHVIIIIRDVTMNRRCYNDVT